MSSAPSIVTPDERLRVFVSSTIEELTDERAAVREAIERLRLSPVLFELGARPHPPQDVYQSYLERSDVFVGIYGESYGWIGPGMDISGLEDEYVRSAAKPRLLYVKAPAPARDARLTAFIERLMNDGTVSFKTFRDSEELRDFVENDLALLLTERFVSRIDEDMGGRRRTSLPTRRVRRPGVGAERAPRAARGHCPTDHRSPGREESGRRASRSRRGGDSTSCSPGVFTSSA